MTPDLVTPADIYFETSDVIWFHGNHNDIYRHISTVKIKIIRTFHN